MQGVFLALLLFFKYPADDALRLQRKYGAQCAEARLTNLPTSRHILQVAESISGALAPSGNRAAVLDAVFGAFFEAVGGGISCISQLWHWLGNEAEAGTSRFLCHFLFGQGEECNVKGRTPTVSSMQEVDSLGETCLRVLR